MEDQANFVPLHYSPEERRVSPELEQYKHVLLLAHGLPRYQEIADYHHQRLLVRGNEHGFDIDRVSSAPTLEGNKALLEDIDETTIIGVVGGDGMASLALHAAYDLDLENPFMILNGGNARNQGRMHHPSRFLYKPERILEKGHIEQTSPLVVVRRFPDGTYQTDLAFAYWTNGLTARATAGFNTPEHRQAVEDDPKRKLALEAKITLEARKQTVPFVVQEVSREARVATELGFVSGKLMAKYMRFPADLFRKEAVIIEASDTRLLTIGRTIVSLAMPLAKRRHEWLNDGNQRSMTLVSIDGSDLLSEIDGDAQADPSGTTYNVGISDKHVNVISTRGRA